MTASPGGRQMQVLVAAVHGDNRVQTGQTSCDGHPAVSTQVQPAARFGDCRRSTTNNSFTVTYPFFAPKFAGQGIDAEVSSFIASAQSFNPATSLFMLWGGPNDLFINPSVATANAAIVNLSNELMALYEIGARNFIVPNMFDLAMTPWALSQAPADRTGLHALSLGFDGGLQSALNSLSGLPQMNIIQVDMFGFFAAIAANPGAYGFTNVTDPCFNGVSVCVNPDQYLFWDSVHPTAYAAQIMGDEFTRNVGAQPMPEPATFALLGLGLVGIAASRRRPLS